jgi:hypothetical protein
MTKKLPTFIHFVQTEARTQEHEKYTQNLGGNDNAGNQGADEKLIRK